MGPAAIRNVKTVALPLLVRAVSTGALLGACISAGISAFSIVQAALYPEQFGLWGMNGGQIFFMAVLGLVLGAGAGLATGAGSVAALWIDASTSLSVVLPGALTAGLGAAAVTAVYTVVAFHALGETGLALAGFGASFATVSGLLAAFHTRRLIQRYYSTGQKQAH
ncbi:hypothetical protein [Pseudarthrobacter sp. PS3-L1]|uniref:hypothetical protein n=1 Tax=Pseudarthrobacter sp. PS3-L1 TaxID=3046207 RepID=UPI0024B8C914|nr:hypothetical protein [Pseudarthrobacter sp. PS3-L1]MDJ0322013.1 hypothetical protein [Pseudarthrobacter sp. PS3-L1]